MSNAESRRNLSTVFLSGLAFCGGSGRRGIVSRLSVSDAGPRDYLSPQKPFAGDEAALLMIEKNRGYETINTRRSFLLAHMPLVAPVTVPVPAFRQP